MAKKFTGIYTADATKALKSAERIMCKIGEDGAIYVCTGFYIYKMNRTEYEAIARPATMCDPGDWSIDRDGNRTDVCQLDIIRIFCDADDIARSAAILKRSPMTFGAPGKNGSFFGYYNHDKDFAAFYDQRYVSSISAIPGIDLKTPKALAPAVAYVGSEAVALILPINAKDDHARAVKAFFKPSAGNADAQDSNTQNSNADKINALNNELAACQNDLQRTQDELSRKSSQLIQAQDEIETLRAENSRYCDEIAALREQFAQQAAQSAAAQSKPEPKTSAEMIAARFADMAGVTATIKGANTAAPVVWLAGNTKHHAAEIEAAGAQWSTKKSAYYFRVA